MKTCTGALLAIATCVLIGMGSCAPVAHREKTAPSDHESIGVATMEADGTIVLDLRAAGSGALGDAQLRYPKDHPDYAALLKHLGGLHPGESKPVPPWPADR